MTDMRCFVARPDYEDDNLIRVQQNGRDEYRVMTEDEYAHWLTLQPYNVVYRLAYPE